MEPNFSKLYLLYARKLEKFSQEEEMKEAVGEAVEASQGLAAEIVLGSSFLSPT